MSPLAPSFQVFHRSARPHGLPSARLECQQTILTVSQQGPSKERWDDAELAAMPGTFIGRLLVQPFTARVARGIRQRRGLGEAGEQVWLANHQFGGRFCRIPRATDKRLRAASVPLRGYFTARVVGMPVWDSNMPLFA